MNLEEAVRIGRGCGLVSIEDCVYNIEIHSMNLFVYKNIPKELKELHDSYKEWKDGNYKLDIDSIDNEVKLAMDKMLEEEVEYHKNLTNLDDEVLIFETE